MSTLLAEASNLLQDVGFLHVERAAELAWPTPTARVFEGSYAIVAVAAFETWDELRLGWLAAQSTLVGLVSEHIASSEPKAWEGYLVLLTPGTAGANREQVEEIRYDVSRLRKFVADAVELSELGAVRRVLAPLLPIPRGTDGLSAPLPALQLLTNELLGRGLEPDLVSALTNAFDRQEPLMEAIHDWRRGHAID
jgi:hypothetical protein